MERWIIAAALAASFALPVAAQAQPAGGPGPGGPPPAARAKFEQILGDARIAALNALSPDHRAAVRALTDQVQARTLDRRTGAQKIDALLSADERTRLNAVEQKLRTDMRAAMGGLAPPPGGPPPGGPPPGSGTMGGPVAGGEGQGGPPSGGAGPPGGGRYAARAADPGRFLLTLSRSRRFRGPEPRSSRVP